MTIQIAIIAVLLIVVEVLLIMVVRLAEAFHTQDNIISELVGCEEWNGEDLLRVLRERSKPQGNTDTVVEFRKKDLPAV